MPAFGLFCQIFNLRFRSKLNMGSGTMMNIQLFLDVCKLLGGNSFDSYYKISVPAIREPDMDRAVG